jgi:rhamnulokinase
MTPPAFLAFDLGASSGRGMRGELRDGRLSVSEFCRFPNGMISVLGHLHWNIYGLFEHIKLGLSLYAAKMDRPPESIGIDTWGVDFGLLARDGSLLGLPYGYRDHRTEGAMDSFFAKMSADRVYELTGIQFLPFNSLFQLEAMVRDGSPLLDSAADLLFMPDLLNYLLTGIKKTEFTFATTSQIYNPIKGNWEEELLSTLDLPVTMMQEIIQPGSLIGETVPEVAGSTGLPQTPVVAVATHDTGSAVAAVPAEGEGWAYISSGTWSLMGIEVSTPIITRESLELNFTNEGGVEGTFRFLKNIAGLWLLEECRRIWAKERECRYEELMQLAESAEPFAALIDPDREEFLNPPDMTEAIRNVCTKIGQKIPDSPGAFVRCILESLALKYRFVLDQLRQVSDNPIDRIHVIGGGSRNQVLCQFTANATQLPVIAGPSEATAIGNIMMQALSRGHVASLAEMRAVIRRSCDCATYEPQQIKEWDSAYDRFRDIIGA